MEREVRYCTTEDGVRIAYCVEGEGPPLVVCPWFIDSFALEHLVPELQAFMRRLGQGRRLVRYDMRGTGLSQRDVDDLSHSALVGDIQAVVRAARLKQFALWGRTTSGPTAIGYAARHRRQVSHLILWGTYSRLVDVMPPEAVKSLAALARANWPVGAQTYADLANRQSFPELNARIADLFRQSTSGEVVEQFFLTNLNLDLTELLPAVRTRTLIFHHMNDPIIPFVAGQALAARIPDARLVALEGSTHNFFIEGDPWFIVNEMNAFLSQDAEPTSVASSVDVLASQIVRTVLFTDMAGSTEMMQRLGDERGREVLREHERITREVLKAHGGTEVKTMGDGFMASFGSVTRAVECAIALQRAFEEREGEPLRIRIGLNAGEPIEEDGDLFGATVILAARIASQADGGEILASDVVRGLCAGKGLLFADRGEFVAKGFEEPVRLYEVSWREE
jgi:class 3 adenylate cyclase